MKKLVRCILLGLTAFANSALTQDNPDLNKATFDVIKSTQRTDLAVDITAVAKLKVAVRKSTYRLGEMLILDLAMLSTNSDPVFVPSVRNAEVSVNGKIIPYVIPNSSASLIRAEGKSLETASFLYVLGCTEQAFTSSRARRKAEDSQLVFEDNLFVSWGRGCVDMGENSELKVQVEVVNMNVVVSREFPNTKTAVGTLRSSPILISVK